MAAVTAKPHFFDFTPESLSSLLESWRWPRFRAAQVMDWVYRKGVADPLQMSNLSLADRKKLADEVSFLTASVVAHQQASDGVQKLLMDWQPRAGVAPASDGVPAERSISLRLAEASPAPGAPAGSDPRSQTECVMIPAESRRTACISSQIGCPVGCTFCASGLGGLDGNLTAGQIVEQVWRLSQLEGVGRISHVVFMGMGEPLANFEQVTRAAATLMAEWGMGISGRRITLSTVGLPAQIRRLADLQHPMTLAISLHAPNDDIRRKLIPWAQYVTISQLLEAGRYYFEVTGREITLEYILLRGVNDQPQHAKELAEVARSLRANVNLIRYNEVRSLPYQRPATEDVLAFQRILQSRQVNVHIRASRGRDIAAACGQLRHDKSASASLPEASSSQHAI